MGQGIVRIGGRNAERGFLTFQPSGGFPGTGTASTRTFPSSRTCPSRTSVTITAAASKYTDTEPDSFRKAAGKMRPRIRVFDPVRRAVGRLQNRCSAQLSYDGTWHKVNGATRLRNERVWKRMFASSLSFLGTGGASRR